MPVLTEGGEGADRAVEVLVHDAKIGGSGISDLDPTLTKQNVRPFKKPE